MVLPLTHHCQDFRISCKVVNKFLELCDISFQGTRSPLAGALSFCQHETPGENSHFLVIYCFNSLVIRLRDTRISLEHLLLWGQQNVTAVVLQRNSNIWFSLRSTIYVISGPGPPEQRQVWVRPRGPSIQSNQIVAGYSHSFCAAVTPTCLVSRSPLQKKGFTVGLLFTLLLW